MSRKLSIEKALIVGADEGGTEGNGSSMAQFEILSFQFSIPLCHE